MPTGFVTEYPTANADLIEQFTALDSGSMGSTTSTAGVTWTADGVSSGADSSGESISWSNAFVTGTNPLSYALSGGYTLQFDIESGFFAEGSLSAAGNRVLTSAKGSVTSQVTRHLSQQNWRISSGGFGLGARTLDNGYGSHVPVTVSYSPPPAGGGSQGLIDLYVGYYHLLSTDCTVTPTFTDVLTLLGDGTGNAGFRAKNVMLFNSPTTLVGVNEVEIVLEGDSFTKYGQYQLGGDTNNTGAVLLGWQTEDYADTSLKALTTAKNRGFNAELHYQLALQGLYPKDGRIKFYGRGGTEALSSASKPLSDRVDAALASTGASGPPYPYPGLGTGAVKIPIIHVGTNDVASANDVNTVIADITTELDRHIADGATRIIVDNVAKRYDSSPVTTQIDIAATEAMNAGIATLQGYGGITVVVDIYTDWIIGYMGATDGIHPDADGQVFWAQQVAVGIAFALAAPTLTTPYTNMTVTLKDALNFDVTTVWSGATSYTINGLTYALEDVSGVIQGLICDSGVRNISIVAENEYSTNSDSFIIQVLSGIPNKLNG